MTGHPHASAILDPVRLCRPLLFAAALAVAVVLDLAADVGRPASVPEPLWKVVYETEGGTLDVINSALPRPRTLMRTPRDWKGEDSDRFGRQTATSSPFSAVVPGCDQESLYVVRSDGRLLRRLLARLRGTGTLAWSPDGQRLAVWGPSNTLSVVDRTGGTVRRLLHPPASRFYQLEKNVEWARDGRKLLCGCANGIYTLNADGTGKRLLMVSAGGGGASWSPDGVWIAYKRNCAPFAQEVYCDVAVMRSDGSHRRVLVKHSRGHGSMAKAPVWLPRSEDVVVAEDGYPPYRLIAVNARTGVERIILKQTGGGDELRTSADGATIGCYCRGPYSTGLLLVHPDGHGRRFYGLPFDPSLEIPNDLWLR
jgi:Tol biopolymer transport system component